jgi:hypothetical protein
MKEAERELLNYGRRHPFAFRYLAGLIMGRRAKGVEESARSMSQSIPLVSFRSRCLSRVIGMSTRRAVDDQRKY